MSSNLKYTDTEYVATADFDGWEFRMGGSSASTKTLLGISPDGETVERISVGNWIYETRTICSKSGMRLIENRRGRLAELKECLDGEIVALVDFGSDLARVNARSLLVDVATHREQWSIEAPSGMDPEARTLTEWIDVQEQADAPEPESTSDLTFEKIEGRGAQTEVNAFLEGSSDGLVSHSCGGIHHWKAGFVARYEGEIIGAIVLAPPQNGVLAARGEEIVISRIACHPNRPKNTSTWLISKARKWAERAGYSKITSLAGVGGNRGSCYKGAGFTLEEEEPEYIDGEGNKWHRRKYSYQLNPEKYAGRDVPMPGVDHGTA